MTSNELDPQVMWRDVNRLKKLMDGDDYLGIVGLRDQVADHEQVIAEIRQFKIMLRGVMIGLGVNALGILGVAWKVLEG